MKIVNKNKGSKKGPLTKEEKNNLQTPVKNLNFKYASRPHALNYITGLKKKIDALEESRLGKDWDNSLKFSSEFVYKLLVDAWRCMMDYISLKDENLYTKYASVEYQNNIYSAFGGKYG